MTQQHGYVTTQHNFTHDIISSSRTFPGMLLLWSKHNLSSGWRNLLHNHKISSLIFKVADYYIDFFDNPEIKQLKHWDNQHGQTRQTNKFYPYPIWLVENLKITCQTSQGGRRKSRGYYHSDILVNCLYI